ncbi:reverse transcriptase domain-containing protein [Candidatus Tisiphia endosymbiont of Nemotelus nigrinus]|uniref:reverse transcriptase domain-containing protein n=1 Tax=Candidatus Tisiphia endosymbiont of Nemotelus nigrinus TaxID=3066263 RepID=UPI00312CBFD2
MITTDYQVITETKLKRIAWLSSLDKSKRFNNLMHLFSENALAVCYHELDVKKATGVDGVNKTNYGLKLTENIGKLSDKLKRMAYIPGNIREVKIPKEGSNGKTRTLGISNFEDKICQKMMHKVLESIYEPIFLECSYGFRTGIGCHDAIRGLTQHLYSNEVESVIDLDLANFFGTIDRRILIEMLQEKIHDKKLIRYIIRMFKAGILSEGELIVQEEGTIQGNIASPILANIFAHYVLDEWFEEVVKQHCRGTVALFRYCDDGVICCRYQEDAKRIKIALAKRLEKYKLKLNEEKTKMVRFSKRKFSQNERQEAFDFLGFTFYFGKSRKGKIIPKVKSCSKRISAKLKKVNDWCKDIRNKHKLHVIWRSFCSKLRGHIQYYGVTFNIKAVNGFIRQSVKTLFKWLNRRSQRESFSWEKFCLFIECNPLPKVRIYHSLMQGSM